MLSARKFSITDDNRFDEFVSEISAVLWACGMKRCRLCHDPTQKNIDNSLDGATELCWLIWYQNYW